MVKKSTNHILINDYKYLTLSIKHRKLNCRVYFSLKNINLLQ